jgi:alpha-tubulin suppressor-like RCC1 family protein
MSAARRPVRATRTVARTLALLAVIPMLAAVAPVGPGPVGPAPAAASTTIAPSVTPSVATGGEHTCAVRTDGSVWCWGRNDSGQLGDGTIAAQFGGRSNPGAVVGLSGVRVRALALGSAHTCALVDDGTVRCWGEGRHGRLGNGSTDDSPTPVEVSGISTATAITAGNDHTCALLGDGTVRCWGNNSLGQLGDGTTNGRTTPVAVTVLSGATAISAGNAHTCAIVTGGEVRCWGFNAFGGLGDGTTTDSTTPVAVLRSGTDQSTSPRLAGVTALSAGGNYTCAIIRDPSDEFVCWGGNSSGQLGDGTTTNRSFPVAVSGSTGMNGVIPVAVSAGNLHTCDLLGTGTVRCWGYGEYGQLGLGDTTDRDTPVAVSGLVGVAMISSGGLHTCALMDDDTVRCWGDGRSGRLGDGTTTRRTSPVSVLASGTAAASPVAFSVRVTVVDDPVVPPAPTVAVACVPGADGGVLGVGAQVTCTVTGGDPGIDILWRASVNPVIAEAGVTLDADGRGTFAFTVPAGALGATLVVELVEWTAPVAIGVVGPGSAGAGGPVPTRVPAGEGPWLWSGGEGFVVLLALVGMLAVAGTLAVAGARSSSAGRR